MNILDRSISWFAPATAARRLHARMVLNIVERQFDGAKTTRRTANWKATGTSANAETSIGLDRLRWRARDFERNNGQAAGILRKLPAYMVGPGITIRPKDGDKARLKKNWAAFMRSSDISTGTNYNAQMYLAARTIARDGEVILSWQDTPDPARPLALHVLEADFLDTSRNAEVAGGNVIIQGVQFDPNGRRVGYWLFDQHPGEPVPIRKSAVSRFVDASRVDHIFDILRPGQARGIPWVAPIMLRMRDVAEYEDAELVRKKIESCYSVFIRRNDVDGSVPAGPQPQAIDPVTGDRLDTLKPGMIHRLGLGEEVTFGEPRQSIAVSDYLKSQWLSISFGVGMPYSMATGDLSNANYGSQRAGLLDWWQLLDHWQWNMLIAMAYEKAWRRVHEAFGRLGQGPSGNEIPEASYSPPKREWIDPLKDGQAEALKLRIGKVSWPQMIAEGGEDPEEQEAEIATWKPRLDPLGLDYSANGAGAKPAGAGADGEADNPGNNDGENAGATPPASGRLLVAGELSEMRQAATLCFRALALQATREAPAPTINVAAPVVNLNPSIAVQERADGSRNLIVERDANNRIKSARLEPVKQEAGSNGSAA
jgi:lambda family phage portal protein